MHSLNRGGGREMAILMNRYYTSRCQLLQMERKEIKNVAAGCPRKITPRSCVRWQCSFFDWLRERSPSPRCNFTYHISVLSLPILAQPRLPPPQSDPCHARGSD